MMAKKPSFYRRPDRNLNVPFFFSEIVDPTGKMITILVKGYRDPYDAIGSEITLAVIFPSAELTR
jgi:hypothetical protein